MPDKKQFPISYISHCLSLGQCLPAELSLLGGKTFLLLFF